MRLPYETILKHPSDFRVAYRFYTEQEGGRKTAPRQGYRCDFWYHHEEHSDPTSVYMIWPDFEDDKGNVIIDTEVDIISTGTARMWIITPAMRKVHQERIRVGTRGFFMEGLGRVAECEVIELVGLNDKRGEE